MSSSARAPRRPRQPPPEYLVVGDIVAPFGTRGEVKVRLDTDFPGLVLQARYLYIGDPPIRCQVESARMHKGMVRLKLSGCDSRDRGESLRGALVQVRADEVPVLEEGEYYYHQLVDLEVWTEEGELLGQVAEILATGSNEVLVVRNRGREMLLPLIDSVVREVDLEEGRIYVHLVEGLR